MHHKAENITMHIVAHSHCTYYYQYWFQFEPSTGIKTISDKDYCGSENKSKNENSLSELYQ
jgi:hypothetical protein